ncbi:zinc finger protein ZPR1-like [Panonychus citri]|uniref:zinc finger protein ZPR1-like n=1 Tax=Panonychus citri TaxID=50023 RepID=UPI002306F6AA|nr:zinc finger protein ZPR1-like [Panonychus citri]
MGTLSERPEFDEIESLCVNCRQDGITKLLVTKIPFFREVIIMSFSCDNCGYSNNELQPASTIQEKGINIRLKVKSPGDMDRQVVKSDYAEISIPELEFTASRQPGLVTTVEGLIDRAIDGLRHTIQMNSDQPELITKLADFVIRLDLLKSLEQEFTIVMTDSSGNSFIENPLAPKVDPQMEIIFYTRSIEENKTLGIYSIEEEPPEPSADDLKNEVLQFRTNCYSCGAICFTNMKLTAIPHFKDVIIMATNCDACGYKTTEIKSGQGIGEKGVKIILPIVTEEDLKRDVVRSETCSLTIPEVDLDIGRSGSGKYTTVEGLIEQIKEGLEKSDPFVAGDSAPAEKRARMTSLIDKLKLGIGLTIILDDPCGNSFVDGATNIEHYERTFDQNEELGLNDMKTDL